MWMQVVGAHGHTNNEPSHHHHLHHQQVDGSRKLRPLIPRPPPSASASSHECNFGIYTADGSVGTGEKGFSQKNVNSSSNRDKYKEESKAGRGVQEAVMSATSSSRWNPTAEQLRTLEDLYRNGTRTPSTDQIQRITAQLRRFGNIEGKNVFYWFQNHKARERQKRRRQSHHHPILNPTKQLLNITPTGKQLGFDAQQTRPHYAAAEEFGEMSMQYQRGGEEKAISDNRSENITTLNNHIIGSSADCAVACLRFQLDDQRNATWNNFAPSSYSTTAPEVDGVTFKTRRLLATDQTTTHRETTSQLLYEDQDSATLLQLFPLRIQVNGGQQQNDEDDLSKERDDVHFFEFLPTKIN